MGWPGHLKVLTKQRQTSPRARRNSDRRLSLDLNSYSSQALQPAGLSTDFRLSRTPSINIHIVGSASLENTNSPPPLGPVAGLEHVAWLSVLLCYPLLVTEA